MQLELYAEVCIVVLCGAKSQAFILVLSDKQGKFKEQKAGGGSCKAMR